MSLSKEKKIKLQNYNDTLLGNDATFILFNPNREEEDEEIKSSKNRRPDFVFSETGVLKEYNGMNIAYVTDVVVEGKTNFIWITKKNLSTGTKHEVEVIGHKSPTTTVPNVYSSFVSSNNFFARYYVSTGKVLVSYTKGAKKEDGAFLIVPDKFEPKLTNEQYDLLKKIKKRNLDSTNEPKIVTVKDKWGFKVPDIDILKNKNYIKEKSSSSSFLVTKLGLLVVAYFGLLRPGSIKNDLDQKSAYDMRMSLTFFVEKENKFVNAESEDYLSIVNDYKEEFQANNVEAGIEYKSDPLIINFYYKNLEKIKKYMNKNKIRLVSITKEGTCKKLKLKVNEVKLTYL